MLNCTTKKYTSIYAPWLRQPRELLDLVNYEPGQKLLDLCGGTGAVSLAAHFRHHGVPSDITLFDLNLRYDHPDVKTVKGRAEDMAVHFERDTFDLIVCRQAVGYLNPKLVFPAIARILKPGGMFVFNSFMNPLDPLPGGKPPKPYSWKFYDYAGNNYVEFHYTWRDRIFHLQWRIGVGWDATFFKYHEALKLMDLLLPLFNAQVIEKGRGLRWTCIKRGGLEAIKETEG